MALLGICLLAPTDSWAQCTKDTDCKGDRICRKGNCVGPTGSNALPKCSKDTECTGTAICRKGQCLEAKQNPSTKKPKPVVKTLKQVLLGRMKKKTKAHSGKIRGRFCVEDVLVLPFKGAKQNWDGKNKVRAELLKQFETKLSSPAMLSNPKTLGLLVAFKGIKALTNKRNKEYPDPIAKIFIGPRKVAETPEAGNTFHAHWNTGNCTPSYTFTPKTIIKVQIIDSDHYDPDVIATYIWVGLPELLAKNRLWTFGSLDGAIALRTTFHSD